MTELLTTENIAYIGSISSIASLLFGVVQLMKYRAAKEKHDKLKQIRGAQIWGSINLTLEAYDTLNEAKDLVFSNAKDPDINELACKIVSARKSTVAQYLRLLEQAILDEERFTEETAKEWKEKGLLENEWRYKAALKLAQGKTREKSKSLPD